VAGMLEKIHNMLKKSDTELNYKRTLTDNKTALLFIDSVDDNAKIGLQIYRANHGGGMPCAEKVCFSANISEDL
jgi:hypothetical protein